MLPFDNGRISIYFPSLALPFLPKETSFHAPSELRAAALSICRRRDRPDNAGDRGGALGSWNGW